MVAGVCLIVTITLVNSRGRILWEDETLAWVLLRDPSWHHMLHAWALGADGGGFTFYVVGRLWFFVFGSSAIAFRMFSSACFGLAFLVLWRTLRRFYPVGAVSFAMFNTAFFSPPLTMHYVEGRFYGLLVLEVALALWLSVRLAALPGPFPRRYSVIAFLVHSALVTTHVLGIVYSAMLLLALVIADRVRERRRMGLYLAIVASWLWLVPEKAALVATSRVGEPHFWTKAPSAGQLIGAYCGSSLEIFCVLLILVLGVALGLPRTPLELRAAVRRAARERLDLYAGAGCLLLVPICLVAMRALGPWLFTDRYLQPVSLAIACVTAELCFALGRRACWGVFQQRGRKRTMAAGGLASLAFLVFLFFWVFDYMGDYTPAVGDFTPQLTAKLPHDLPVVVNDALTFTDLMARQADSGVHYTFLLDWQYALSKEAPRLEVTQYHLMENWKRAGIFEQHIAYVDPFLREHDRFVVISNQSIEPSGATRAERGTHIAERLASLPGYTVERLFTLDRLYKDHQRDTVWLVHRTVLLPE